MAFKILQIDGGGIKGIIPAVICAEIEKKKGKLLCNIFDMISGTSTGAIIGGALASGASANTIKDMYLKDGPELFTPRSIFNLKRYFVGVYNRKIFLEKIKSIVGNKTLKVVKTKYIATCFNLSSGRTHFINSTDKKDKNYKLYDVISWSALSAAAFFGKINVEDFIWDHYAPDGTVDKHYKGATFQDGGQGTNNCTLNNDLAEVLAKKYKEVIIISLGCGTKDNYKPYYKTSKEDVITQIISYFSQARNESTIDQILEAKYIEKHHKNIKVFRLDVFIPKKMDGLDKKQYSSEYEKMGISLCKKIPYKLL